MRFYIGAQLLRGRVPGFGIREKIFSRRRDGLEMAGFTPFCEVIAVKMIRVGLPILEKPSAFLSA